MSSVPPPPPPPFEPMPTGVGETTDAGGFFGSLFDMSFKSFVTPKIIKVVFVLGIVFAALYAIVFLVALASQGGGGVVIGLVGGALIFLLAVIGVRIYLEVVMVLFRIEANTRKK